MPLVDNVWYINYGDGATTGYYGVAKWTTGTKTAGTLIRQFTTPAVGSERCFVCTTAGAASGTEPGTWNITRGALTTDNAVVWQECTGIAALNGDATNTPNWTTISGTAIVLGQVIKNNAATNYQICTVAGTAGSGAEPAFSSVAGTVTNDGATLRWTSLGVVGNWTAFKTPHARLGNATIATWGQAGNKFFVADNHAETQSTANVLVIISSASAPSSVYCVDRTIVPPTSSSLMTTASISTTGNSTLYTISTNFSSLYVYGITFSAGSGANVTNFEVATFAGTTNHTYEACTMANGVTVVGGINIGNVASTVTFINTKVQFAATGDGIYTTGKFTWTNTAAAVAGATLPTSLFQPQLNTGGTVIVDVVDLSALGSGKTLVLGSNANSYFMFKNVKLGSAVTVASTPTSPQMSTDVVSSDSAATNYRQERYNYAGTMTTETSVTRTDGASNGTTHISWKIVNTANSSWLFPFASFPIAIWNSTITGSTTITVCGTINAVSVPTNEDIWMEVTYMNSALTPIDTLVSTSRLALASSAPLTIDTSTWNGGGSGAGWSPFKLTTTITSPAQAGYIYVTIKTAKVSTTYYVDPLITLT